MGLTYAFLRILSAISMVTILCGLNASFVQAMDDEDCLFCGLPYTYKSPVPFKTLKQLITFVHEEGLIFREARVDARACSEDAEREHVAKKQKTSDDANTHIFQHEPDVSSLIPLALDHHYEKFKHKNMYEITRWEQIVAANPNAKSDILTFYQDLLDLNPWHFYSKVCCMKSVRVLLNSPCAYLIMKNIEEAGWGENCDIPVSLGSLLWIRSLMFEEESLADPRIPPVVMQLTNLVNLVVRPNEICELPQELMGLTKLQKLEIDLDVVEQLPNGIGNLTALRELTLEDNCFTMLPNEIGKLTNLVKLDVRSYGNPDTTGRPLKSLPTSLANLTNLLHLYWFADKLSFLPTSFGKFLTKKERKYDFKVYLPFPRIWVSEDEIELNTIYLKPQTEVSTSWTVKCRYLVAADGDKRQYCEGEFEYSPFDVTTTDALEKMALKVLSDLNIVPLFEIRCDRFCRWEADNHKFCGFFEEGEDRDNPDPDEHAGFTYCGLPYLDYKNMLADCYNRYHDHLLMRLLLNELGNVIDLPEDILRHIAGLMYEVEEQDLWDQIPQYQRLYSTLHESFKKHHKMLNS